MLKVEQATIIVTARMQTAHALSSGEAEYYALVLCAADLLYVQALMEFLGVKLEGVLFTDSSAAMGLLVAAVLAAFAG